MSRSRTFALACAFVACALLMEAMVRKSELAAQVPGATGTGPGIGTPFRALEAARSGLSSLYGTGEQEWQGDPHLFTRWLEARGFTDISNIRQRGGAIICEATGPRRERVRLVLDAASGELAGVQVIGFDGKPY